ncbi:hypothetical protein IT084_12810 [Desulfallas sp. Bu1-1]|uniref:hypothetical protein n=1 Tax=Desulfallas sp. Bu1-1 TaxID=2787620 RepID=UPI00189C736C|nr:hypothetical protein [Desulfallas sp. Bu1-1]MBF7083854.1 hypothetical protein [Desulfallas sp. Bu1-1]
METFLGIPLKGWPTIALWILVIIIPWTYSLYFFKQIDRSGVERWGAKTADKEQLINNLSVR